METATQSGSFVGVWNDVADVSGNLVTLAVEAFPSGLLAVGPTGEIALVNAALERLFGYRREELIGQPVELLLPGGFRLLHAEHEPACPSVAQKRSTGTGCEVFGRRKDGCQIPVEIGLTPVQTTAGPFTLVSVVDVSEQRYHEQEHLKAFNARLEFEWLLAELSAQFVDIQSEHIDEAIFQAQRRIAEALDLDRATLFQISAGEDDFVLTHHWTRGGNQPPAHISAKLQFPWSLQKIRNGEAASFSSIDEVPDALERESLRYYGTKSRVALPIQINGETIGVVAFAATRKSHDWPPATLVHLHLVARVLSSALARKRADAALRASEKNFRTVADNAPVMIWVAGREKSYTWLNSRWLEFAGRATEDDTGSDLTKGMHPDDIASFLETYAKAFDAREPFRMEYRRRRHDGAWRWILDSGAPNHAADGRFEGYIGSCIDVTEERQGKMRLESALTEVQRLRDQLQAENVYLRGEVQERLGLGPIVGRSLAIRRVLELVEQVAKTDSTALLLGETGTGKELFATQIHELGCRRTRSMVRVNCAAIPATLIESELFGRERGAYTGALTRQIGRFELADHSTIFLDEIGDLPMEVQVKLLRVLEERQIERLGSAKSLRVDARIIAATHRNLEQRIADGAFREDLFYRLNVFPIQVPPLRERVEDIPLLVWRFVEEFSKAFGKRIESISRDNMAALQEYSWPGNIRELRNIVERAMIGSAGTRLTIALPAPSTPRKHYVTLHDVEKEHIRSVLETTGWRIRGVGGAANRLGLKPTTLETRMAKLGLKRPKQAI